MSLLLLFNPTPVVPPVNPQGAFTTAQVQSVEALKPVLYSVENKEGVPVMYFIDTTKVNLKSVQQALGVFQDSTVTYNSTTVTYSSATELYGGMDREQSVAPSIIYSIDQAIPVVYDIKKT